tara:strand:+ start:777 stop:1076 length:300 start_codon:yes stop_codon:yes gene_type:complete
MILRAGRARVRSSRAEVQLAGNTPSVPALDCARQHARSESEAIAGLSCRVGSALKQSLSKKVPICRKIWAKAEVSTPTSSLSKAHATEAVPSLRVVVLR